MDNFKFNTIEEALEDLRLGKIILCTDDPDRKNEGDFICAAEHATTENVNWQGAHLYADEQLLLPKIAAAADGGLQYG